MRANGNDLLQIYQFIDSDQNDNIAYNELMDLLYGKKIINIEAFVRERRKKLGLDTWISKDDQRANA